MARWGPGGERMAAVYPAVGAIRDFPGHCGRSSSQIRRLELPMLGWLFLLSNAAASPRTSQEVYNAYVARHLFRSAYTITEGTLELAEEYDPARAPYRWGVFDGEGELLGAETFAERVGDRGMLRRLKSGGGGILEGPLGVLAALAAVGAGVAGQGYVPTAPDSQPLDLGGTGGARVSREAQVASWYSAEVVDQLIRSYNLRLRRELGLRPYDTPALDGPLLAAPRS